MQHETYNIGIRYGSQAFTASYSRTPMAHNFRFHHHIMYEFYILLNGDVQLWMENTAYDIKPNYLFIFPPNSLHGLISLNEQSSYERMYFHIPTDFLVRMSMGGYDILQMLQQAEEEMRPVYQVNEENTKQLYQIICKIAAIDQAAEGNARFVEFQKHALLSEIVHILVKIIEPQRHSELTVVCQKHPFLSQVLQYINSHYQESIPLDVIAKHVNVSKYHLSHEFTRLTNRTLSSYITMRRVQHALKLLQNGVSPIDACFQSGFSGYSNFQKAFHAHFGVSPKNYKLLNKDWEADT